MESTKNIKKIFVIVPPASGHVNPISGLVYELCKSDDVQVTFYSNESFRESIEKTGAKFRAYSQFNRETFVPQTLKKSTEPAILNVINNFIDLSYILLPQLIKDCQNEKPDLILYDHICLPAR